MNCKDLIGIIMSRFLFSPFNILKKVIVFLRKEYDGLDAFVKDKQL